MKEKKRYPNEEEQKDDRHDFGISHQNIEVDKNKPTTDLTNSDECQDHDYTKRETTKMKDEQEWECGVVVLLLLEEYSIDQSLCENREDIEVVQAFVRQCLDWIISIHDKATGDCSMYCQNHTCIHLHQMDTGKTRYTVLVWCIDHQNKRNLDDHNNAQVFVVDHTRIYHLIDSNIDYFLFDNVDKMEYNYWLKDKENDYRASMIVVNNDAEYFFRQMHHPSCPKIAVSSKTTHYLRWNAAFIGENAFSWKFTNDPTWNQTCFTQFHRFSKITHECPWFQAFRIDFHRCFRYINVHWWSAHTVHMFSSVMRHHRWLSVIVRIHHAWKSVPSEPPGSPVVSTVCHAWSLIIRCHHPTAKARLLLMWLSTSLYWYPRVSTRQFYKTFPTHLPRRRVRVWQWPVINSRFELRSTQSTDQAWNAIKKYRKDQEKRRNVTDNVARWSIRTHFSTKLLDGTKHWLPIDPCWMLCNANRLCLVEQTNGRLFERQHTCRNECCLSTETISCTTAKCSILLMLTMTELSSVCLPRAKSTVVTRTCPI